MANPSFLGTSGGINSTAGSTVIPVTIVSGANRVLMAMFGFHSSSSAIPDQAVVELKTGATVVATMTRLNPLGLNPSSSLSSGGGTGIAIDIFYLLEANFPVNGTYNITPRTASGTPNRNASFQYCVQDTAQQAPPYAGNASNATTTASVAAALSTVAANALFASMWTVRIPTASTVTTPGAGWTELTPPGAGGEITTAGSNDIHSGLVTQSFASPGSQNPAWASSTSTSLQAIANLSFEPVATNTCAVNDYSVGEVIQEFPVLGGLVDLPVSGTYVATDPNTPYIAEWQIENQPAAGGGVVKAWTAQTGGSVSGGVISGGVLAASPVGGGRDVTVGYLIKCRLKNSLGAVIATSANGSNPWGIGTNVVFTGSSSADIIFTTQNTTIVPDKRLSTWQVAGGWSLSGHGALLFAEGNRLIAARPGVPVALMQAGHIADHLQGTAGSYWITTATYTKGPQYSLFTNALAASRTGKIAFVCQALGGNDAPPPGPPGGVAGAQAALTALAGYYRTDTGQPTLVVLLYGDQRAGPPATDDLGNTQVRQAEMAFVAADSRTRYTARVAFPLQSDETHVTPVASDTVGLILANCYCDQFMGIPSNWIQSIPTLDSYNGTTGETIWTFPRPPNGQFIVNGNNDGTFNVDSLCFQITDLVGNPQTVISSPEPQIINERQVSAFTTIGLAGIMGDYMQGANPGGVSSPASPNCVWWHGNPP